MQLFYCPGIHKGDDFLDSEESRHCVKVLRKKVGDLIHITDGAGIFYKAQLTDLNPRKCIYKILTSESSKKNNYNIHVAIAPTKHADRIEWFVEKAVEIGVDKISFIQTSYSERKTINLDRIKKKAISAMKQSVRAFLPELAPMEKLSFILNSDTEDQKYIAHLEGETTESLEHRATPGTSYIILIGPEGGFSDEEISMAKSKQFKVVKIGNHRLRTETAGIVACTILNNLNH
ncbi:MAG: 16S rRNA (uracil(1498)-N(3))-methyltransferase [Cyclobacteriaceae bacterium]|nr:16S rRNA (uracil(1498)-N(3))-methyltransferase [Cyclobacteriaceae bacterium]